MTDPFLSQRVQPCIWMTAGLVAYKLCDRDFDCEHCPLDAALRGELRSSPQGVPLPSAYTATFPEDRVYSSGHLWLQQWRQGTEEAGKRVSRLGVDSFAAALLGSCHELRGASPGTALAAGQTCCELDLGCGGLPLATPVAGVMGAVNPLLEEDPELVSTAPYGEGWLVEVISGNPRTPGAEVVSEVGEAESSEGAGEERFGFSGLFEAEAARERTRLDLRHFRRKVALHMLTDSALLGPTLADGGARLTDLRQMLGERHWLGILRELVH